MADKSIIGMDIGTTVIPVERGKIREFAGAILDESAEYQAEVPPAPPTFTMTVAFWPRVGPMPDLGLNYMRVLHAEQQYEYLLPVAAGDTLTAHTVIDDVYTKDGKKGGTLTFVVFKTSFTNQDNDVAIVARQVIVETAKAAV